MADRYAVRQITGYAIRPGKEARNLTTSYWVADTEDCCREVASFYSRGSANSGRYSRASRLAQAQALCARLNAEERADA